MVGAQRAAVPGSSAGAVTGVAWRDFSPTHPTARGTVEPDEDGLPGLHLSLLNSTGSSVSSTTTDAHGAFRFDNVSGGGYHGAGGLRQLRQRLHRGLLARDAVADAHERARPDGAGIAQRSPHGHGMIIAYLWIWAGFAMVIIAAGLAAIDRAVLEAARIDGATELQTFRRVTMPMLAPVLVVVFVTMVINVLKIFDIVINMAPGSSQRDANTLALSIYNDGFTRHRDTGLASAIAVDPVRARGPGDAVEPEEASRMTEQAVAVAARRIATPAAPPDGVCALASCAEHRASR